MKNSIGDLAIFGGPPVFESELHVGRPYLGNRDSFFRRLNDVLDTKWLTNGGPYVERFERRIEKLLSVKHCIAICNGTVALQIAARAVDLSGEVIIPSFTFVATAHALQWQGITPVFADIDPLTLTIDPKEVEYLITPQTTGIVGVHLWSRTCDVAALEDIGRRRGLRVLFDAAQAFGCSHGGRMVGSFGDAEVLSFHATKFINTFEGGAIVTNEDDIAEKARLMNNFGFTDDDLVESIGINGKMSEVSAAMGLTSLESMDKFIQINCENYRWYQQYLRKCPDVKILHYDESESCNYQYIVIKINFGSAGVSRDQLRDILVQENVLARCYFSPGCHRMEPYLSSNPSSERGLPQTEKMAECLLSLPSGTEVREPEIEKIAHLIQFVAEQKGEVRDRLDAVLK